MRTALALAVLAVPSLLAAQAPSRFPPESLVNVRVIPRTTPVIEVVGQMRNIAGGLGVRCQYCHVGREGMPLDSFDFASDEKRTKLVARQMMRMVEEINRRLDTIPGRTAAGVRAQCQTCHHGAPRPIRLSALMIEMATAGGADSALRGYRALRERYYGRDTYDFGEGSLNTAAFQLARAGRIDDGLAILNFNEQLFPNSTTMAVFRGNITLMRGDTNGAAAAYREAIRRDTSNAEARGRLRDIRRAP